MALAVAGAVASLAPVACSDDTPDASTNPALADIETFALGLGVDADEPSAQLRLAQHDLVVVDGATTSSEALASLQDDGALVLAYLSVGTVEPYRPWYSEAREQGWLLERWDDWDEWYADVNEPGLRDLLLEQARDQLDLGFDGLFLDNVDMVDTHPAQASSMRDLVSELDDLVGERLLFAQNGDPGEQGIIGHLDGWNREDVTFTYDFDADGYIPIGEAARSEAAAALEAVRSAGLLVTTTDYVPEVDPTLWDEAVAVSCGSGAVPYVSDIELTRLPDQPFRCP